MSDKSVYSGTLATVAMIIALLMISLESQVAGEERVMPPTCGT